MAPGPPKIGKDFDFEQIEKYKPDVNAYSAAVEGSVVADTAAAAGGAPCTKMTAGTTPTKLAFCTENGALVVEVQDVNGKVVDSASSISISSTPIGVTGATTVVAAKGVATLNKLYLNSPGTYTLSANADRLISATSNSFTVAVNLDRAKYFRNKIVDNFMADIDHVYGEYTNSLYFKRGFESVIADTEALGLSAASAISLVTRTKTILSALATGLAGVNLSLDKNFFGQQTFAALAIAMQARRDLVRSTILKNEQLSVNDYTLAAAKGNLVSYFSSGTLPGAIQEIQEEAAKTSNDAGKPPTQAGPAAKLAFTHTPNGTAGNSISVVVQVEDANGALVTSATNPITISSSPAGVSSSSLTVNATAGVATFSLTFGTANTYTLTATAAGLTSATNPIIVVASGQPVPPSPAPAKSALRSMEHIH